MRIIFHVLHQQAELKQVCCEQSGSLSTPPIQLLGVKYLLPPV